MFISLHKIISDKKPKIVFRSGLANEEIADKSLCLIEDDEYNEDYIWNYIELYSKTYN